MSLAIVGCTPTEPEKKDVAPALVAEPAKAEAPPPKDPVKAPEAEPTTVATATDEPIAAPTTEPAIDWWCTCYFKHGASGPEPLTACRADQKDCTTLEQSVMAGKKGIVPGSVTHPCQTTKAAHPGDTYGGRDMWSPSSKAGGWISAGACRLPGEGKQVDLGARPKEAEGILGDEKIGELALGLAAAKVVALHGEPGSRGRDEMWEADGAYHQSWKWPQLGLELDMVSDRRKGDKKIGSITARAPSTLATAKGLTIGSPRAEVLKLYGKLRDPESTVDDATQFIAGSIYGGLMFTFAGGKVTEMFLGAAAE